MPPTACQHRKGEKRHETEQTLSPIVSSWSGQRCSEWRLQGQSNEGATQSLDLGHLMCTNLSFFQAGGMTMLLIANMESGNVPGITFRRLFCALLMRWVLLSPRFTDRHMKAQSQSLEVAGLGVESRLFDSKSPHSKLVCGNPKWQTLRHLPPARPLPSTLWRQG